MRWLFSFAKKISEFPEKIDRCCQNICVHASLGLRTSCCSGMAVLPQQAKKYSCLFSPPTPPNTHSHTFSHPASCYLRHIFLTFFSNFEKEFLNRTCSHHFLGAPRLQSFLEFLNVGYKKIIQTRWIYTVYQNWSNNNLESTVYKGLLASWRWVFVWWKKNNQRTSATFPKFHDCFIIPSEDLPYH